MPETSFAQREFVAEEAGNVDELPAMIASVARGRLAKEFANVIGNEPTLCVGYRPNCAVAATFSLGEYLTILCRDEVPFADRDVPVSTGSSAPYLAEAFSTTPYIRACSIWDVPPADAPVHEPVRIQMPALVLAGQFDPFSPPTLTRLLPEDLPAFFVDVPAQAGSVSAHSPCANDIRNAWLDDPTAPPADTRCLTEMKVHFLGGPPD